MVNSQTKIWINTLMYSSLVHINGIYLYWSFLIQYTWVSLLAPDPSARDQHDLRTDECGNIYHRTIHKLSILSDIPTITVKKHDQQPTTIDYYKLKPYSYLGWVTAETIKKTFENPVQWDVTSTRFPMRKLLFYQSTVSQ